MSKENESVSPLFSLAATTTISFTAEQIVEMALNYLADQGHEYNPDSVQPTFNSKGLTLKVETVEGATPTKRKRRKKTAKKATKKVAKAEPEETTTETESEVQGDSDSATSNPFQATQAPRADSNTEATIADVKKEAGVNPDPAFGTDTKEIADTTEEVPDFDFSPVPSE